jgi:cysteine desulfurase
MLSLLRRPTAGTIAVSSVEHPAVREMAESLKSLGWKVALLPSDHRGIIIAESMRSGVTQDNGKDIAMVNVMAVNNESGAIQPVTEIADVLTAAYQGKRRPRFHVDAVQAAGKVPLDLAHPGIDSAAMSAHKLGGPRGIGLLYLGKDAEPFLRGGGQERGYRSGTENLAGAWALSRCLERHYIRAADTGSDAFKRYIARKESCAAFLTALASIQGCTILPPGRDLENYTPYIVQAAFKGIPGEVMLRALDDAGFAISTGSACSSHHKTSAASGQVLQAMGVPAETAQNAVRFSFGYTTAEQDIAALLKAVQEVCQRLHRP